MRAIIDDHRVIVCTGSGGMGKTTTYAELQAKVEPALAELHDTLSDYYLGRRSPHTSFTNLATVPEIDVVVGLHGLDRLAGYLVPAG